MVIGFILGLIAGIVLGVFLAVNRMTRARVEWAKQSEKLKKR